MYRTPRRKGFSLLEIIVVISIIAVLSSLGITSYTGFTQRGRDDRRILDAENLRGSLRKYYDNQPGGFYPATIGELVTDGYIDRLPTDPLSGVMTAYQYVPSPALCDNDISTGNYCSAYTISVNLENRGSEYLIQSRDISGNIIP